MLILQESPSTFTSSKHGCIEKDSPRILHTNRSIVHKSEPDRPKYRLHVSHKENPGVTKSTKCISASDRSVLYQSVLGVCQTEHPRVLHAQGHSVLANERPKVYTLHKPRAVCHTDGGTLHRCQNSFYKAERSEVFRTTKALNTKETPGVMTTNRALNAGAKLGPFKATPMCISEHPDVYKSTKCVNDVQEPGGFQSPYSMSVSDPSRTLTTSRSMSVSDIAEHSYSSRTFSQIEKVESLGKLNTVYENDRTTVSRVPTAFTFREDNPVTSNPRTFTLKEEQKYLGEPVAFSIKDKPVDLGEPSTFKHQEEVKRNVSLKTSIHRKERIEVFFASNTTFAGVGERNESILRRLESISAFGSPRPILSN